MRSNDNRNTKEGSVAKSSAEPEIAVAPATLDGGSNEMDIVVEAEAYQVLDTEYDPKSDTYKGTTTNVPPPFQTNTQDGADNLPTANAQPVQARRTKKYGRSPATAHSGEELLHHMKQRRKAATVSSGVWGGILGLLLLGPIGAVGIGYGSAIITKKSLKSREKKLRKHLEGRLQERVFFY